jgi:hypothetical protein
MKRLKRFASNHTISVASLTVAVLGCGAGGALAAVTGGHAHSNRPAARASTPTQRQRERVVARKRHGHRVNAGAATTTAETYPDSGITVAAPSANATTLASQSQLSSAAAAAAAFRASPAAQNAFGPAVSGTISASLQTVTEQEPIATGVKKNTPYQAWVVSVQGPVIFTGGPNSTPPPADTQCQDVGIYDLQTAEWSDYLQSCPGS